MAGLSWVCIVYLVGIMMKIGQAAVPTGQPSGVPSSRPTASPTTYYQSTISVNVTLLLHSVVASSFNTEFATCAKTAGSSVAIALGLQPEEGFQVFETSVVGYENQIYDYNFLGYSPGDGDLSIWTSRRLGMTSGSYGVTLHMALVANPSRLGFTDSSLAYTTVMGELKDTVVSRVLTSFMRDQAVSSGCTSLQQIDGITVAYISNQYRTAVLRMAAPTSSPTVTRAHYRNRDGVIAGLLIGITAFIVVAMVLAKYQTLEFFGYPHTPSRLETDRRTEANFSLLGQTSGPEVVEVELANAAVSGEGDQ